MLRGGSNHPVVFIILQALSHGIHSPTPPRATDACSGHERLRKIGSAVRNSQICHRYQTTFRVSSYLFSCIYFLVVENLVHVSDDRL